MDIFTSNRNKEDDGIQIVKLLQSNLKLPFIKAKCGTDRQTKINQKALKSSNISELIESKNINSCVSNQKTK